MKKQFNVVFGYNKNDFIDIAHATAMANEINKVNCGIAANTYLLLCIYGEKFPLTLDDTYGGMFFKLGMDWLNVNGYIRMEDNNVIRIIK